MKKILVVGMLVLALTSLAACNNQPDPDTDLPDEPVITDPVEPEDPTDNLPANKEITVEREGMKEALPAMLITSAKSGLNYYLFDNFALTEDEGYDIITTDPGVDAENPMLPASLTINNNKKELTLDEALDFAKDKYPGVEFTDATMVDMTGNMTTAKVMNGTLNDQWVAIIALEGENGTISAWGQGDQETAEGSYVLLLNMLGSVIQ